MTIVYQARTFSGKYQLVPSTEIRPLLRLPFKQFTRRIADYMFRRGYLDLTQIAYDADGQRRVTAVHGRII